MKQIENESYTVLFSFIKMQMSDWCTFQKLVELMLSLTTHIMYISNNVFKRCCGAICKVNKQQQEGIHLFISSVIVLAKLELVVLCGSHAIR